MKKKNNRTENMLLSIELIGSLLNRALLLLALLYVRKALSEKFIAFSSFAREFALMYNIQLHTHLYCPENNFHDSKTYLCYFLNLNFYKRHCISN